MEPSENLVAQSLIFIHKKSLENPVHVRLCFWYSKHLNTMKRKELLTELEHILGEDITGLPYCLPYCGKIINTIVYGIIIVY